MVTSNGKHYDEAVVTAKVHECGGWEPVCRRLVPDTGPAFDAHAQSPNQHVHCPMPSHDDADPSFRIAENNGKLKWHCTCGRGGGNAYNLIAAIKNISYSEAINLVGEEVGAEPKKNRGRKRKADPAEHLEFHDWNEALITVWTWSKPPITPEAVKAFGGRLATYRKQFQVIALPHWGPKLNQGDPVGWTLYPLNGGTLPKYTKGKQTEWVKVKVAYGSEPGIIGPVERIAEAAGLWKAEGPPDALSLFGVLPGDQIPFTNSNGAKERPRQWVLDLAKGKTVNVIHDADRPGQDGATWVESEDGRKRPGWAPAFASTATEVRNLVLPYPIVPDHGPDVRDWLNEGNGWSELEQLRDQAEPIQVDEEETATPYRADDDPAKLAEINLRRYAVENNGATIRFWRDEIYIYKQNRYRKISKGEFRAKMTASVQRTFDQQNIEDQKDTEKELKPAKKVTPTLVNSVIEATRSLTLIPEHVELGTWIDDETRERRNWIAMQNGILDVDALLADGKLDEVLRDHSPAWFSTTRLPYPFDPAAKCPQWNAFLDYNLEGDPERIAILQEWAGYCLLPDTGQQRFLVLEGEGANGKSVYFAALEAMLGTDNVSHVPLEVFGDRFSKSQTLGKLANIAPDAGEIEKQSEGNLKSFTAGERMFFDRKGIDGVEAYPTARLMIGCNNRPRFSDKSDGVWRRMILIPFRITVPESKRIPNLDKPWWWEQSGELPGIFMWAVDGLDRLREQGTFSKSKIATAAVKVYRDELNPAGMFLDEMYIVDKDPDSFYVTPQEVYDRYRRWCVDNGFAPMSITSFGKEVARRFPEVTKDRKKRGGVRANYYMRLRLKREDDESDEDDKVGGDYENQKNDQEFPQ